MAAGMSRQAVHSQLAAALDAVVHVARTTGGRRLLREVAVPVREESGLVRMATAVSFDDAGRARAGPGSRLLDERLAR